MKNVIISGASGLVATELIFNLLKNTDVKLYLLSTNITKIEERYKDYSDRISCFTLDTFSSDISVDYDCCIHTAFSRTEKGSCIVDSINYQRDLIAVLKKLNLGVFVNISSQSVYGNEAGLFCTESSSVNPDYLYALGKYFSEVVTKDMLEGSNIRWTNLRLCSVSENARFIRIFVQNAIEGKPIILTTPNRKCSFIEVQDVADGLMAFIENKNKVKLQPIYNFGANIVDTIKGIAYKVKRIAEERYGLENVKIIEETVNSGLGLSMDASLFMKTFEWSPIRGMDDMIIEMFEMQMRGRGEIPISFEVVYCL